MLNLNTLKVYGMASREATKNYFFKNAEPTSEVCIPLPRCPA